VTEAIDKCLSGGKSALYKHDIGDQRFSDKDLDVPTTDGKEPGGPMPLTEWCGLFDPKDGHDYSEHVITMAGDHTVVRVQENTQWSGVRPYVWGHYIRVGTKFYSVGMIEKIVRLSRELDDTRNLSLIAQHLAISPMIEATDAVELTGNQLTAMPGRVIRTGAPGQLNPIVVPDTTRVALAAEATAKSDIQETTGVPRLFYGSSMEGGDTATEFVGRNAEANLRIEEGAINIAAFALSPALEMFLQLNQEYVTKDKEVALFGKAGNRTGVKKLSPADIAGRARIDIITLKEISLVGLHAQQMIRFLGAVSPLLQANPGLIDIPALLRMSYVSSFGYKDIEQVFPSYREVDDVLSPDEENMMFLSGTGQSVIVMPTDNDILHMKAHIGATGTKTFEKLDEERQRALLAHLENHKLQLSRKISVEMPDFAKALGGVAPMQPAEMAGPNGAAPVPSSRAPRVSEAGPQSPLGVTRSNAQAMTRGGGM